MVRYKRLFVCFQLLLLTVFLAGCTGGCEADDDSHHHDYDPVTYKCSCGDIDPNHPCARNLCSDKTSHWLGCPICGIKEEVQAHDYQDFLSDEERRTCSVCGCVSDDSFLSSITLVLGSTGSFFQLCRSLFDVFPLALRIIVYIVFGAILAFALLRLIRKVGD